MDQPQLFHTPRAHDVARLYHHVRLRLQEVRAVSAANTARRLEEVRQAHAAERATLMDEAYKEAAVAVEEAKKASDDKLQALDTKWRADADKIRREREVSVQKSVRSKTTSSLKRHVVCVLPQAQSFPARARVRRSCPYQHGVSCAADNSKRRSFIRGKYLSRLHRCMSIYIFSGRLPLAGICKGCLHALTGTA